MKYTVNDVVLLETLSKEVPAIPSEWCFSALIDTIIGALTGHRSELN